MNDAFELLDPLNAQAFLKHFGSEARRKGQSLFHGSQVHDLTAKNPGMAYSATVGDIIPCKIQLFYDSVQGWSGECSCEQDNSCSHLFAGMRALLAEHSAAVVRNLSTSRTKTDSGRSQPGTSPSEDTGLARRLMAAIGRPLDAAETKFIRKVQAAFKRVRQMGHITRWDFEELGLRIGGYGWDSLQIWPAVPADEHEFWLYVARFARAQNIAVPEFMNPITDYSRIEERVAKWQRAKEIDKWQHKLSTLALQNPVPVHTARGETDLRLVIQEKEAYLQWLRPSQEIFETVKPGQIHQIANDERRGWINFTTEAALLWQLVSPRFFFSASSHLRYFETETISALGRVLRTHLLDSRVVDVQGQPLHRPAEPLTWQLTPALTEEDDYSFRLIQSNGVPVPPIYCILPGNPTLYLTASSVFAGPQPQEYILDPLVENRIPAPAVERAEGVAFLRNLGLSIPPRITERVRVLPLQVFIHCELKPTYPNSRSEDCVLRIISEASDGHEEYWDAQAWHVSKDSSARARRAGGEIVLYDRSLPDAIPELLQPLSLKSLHSKFLSLRVTKRFPEIFCAWLKSMPPSVHIQLAGELASFANTDVAGKVRLDVTEAEIDWFDLRVVLDVSDTTLSRDEINLLLNAKGNYVRLAGKGWRRLQFNLSEEENERLARLGLSTRALTAEPQRLHALQLSDDAAKKFLPEQQVQQIQRRAADLKARVAPPLPGAISAELRPYQLEGFNFLAYLSVNHFGGILADDMGLGKTLQTLAWLLWLRDEPDVSSPANSTKTSAPASNASPPKKGQALISNHRLPSLVVCPKSVMDNWHAEAARFTSGLRVKVWPSSELAQFSSQLDAADLHVLNYSQLRLLGESLTSIQWQALILDEGQYIKNPSSQTAQIARALRASHRLVLSGTPIENRLMDLWSLMAFAMPGVLGSRAQFGKIYDVKGDPFSRRRLASRVRPFLLRRTKAQVAKDLPDRIEEDLFCEIEGEQKTLYRAELKRAQQILLRVKTQKELAQQQFHFLTSLLRLRQICCHPRLVQPDSTATSAKTEALLEQLEPLMEEGHKVLIFSQFVELLNLLRPAIEAMNWPVFYLAGDTENRGDLVRRFQSAEGPGVFLISLKAGGFGLNLTAASYVILFDPWWNPAVENQAIDRTHRIGQVNKVIAYRLLIKNSIEEKIRELQKSKKALAQDVLGEERFAQSLTLQDLEFLFAD